MSRIRSIPHLGRLVLLTAGVPLVFLAISLALISSWSDRLPSRVATHWGSGGVDATGTRAGLVVPFIVVVLVLAVLFTVIGLWAGAGALGRRLAAGFGVGVTAMICALMLTLTHGQLGLDDALRAPSPTVLQMLLVLLIALVSGTAAALAVGADPKLPAEGPVDPDAPRATLAQGESAMWTGIAASAPMLWLGIALTGALVLVPLFTGGAAAAVPVGIVAGVIVVGASYWRVTVDRRGLRCVGVFGVPRLSVPLDEVESAHETQVRALRDYGGYGLRMGRDGRPGVVLRKGPALEVRRTGGRGLVVTVDRAGEAAALLNTLAERRVSP
ncbi:hypothetical protein [Speluncibacter jeojiensis]|uniref:DUF1648 domain-containing protein n=1 Tax=Speluncibacter jeojiensis TaxID=2710754 RepID=A0A9X4M477_9ACTN|nr:hypothetical protein [Corynebacteriales bacterium D3-21]